MTRTNSWSGAGLAPGVAQGKRCQASVRILTSEVLSSKGKDYLADAPSWRQEVSDCFLCLWTKTVVQITESSWNLWMVSWNGCHRKTLLFFWVTKGYVGNERNWIIVSVRRNGLPDLNLRCYWTSELGCSWQTPWWSISILGTMPPCTQGDWLIV